MSTNLQSLWPLLLLLPYAFLSWRFVTGLRRLPVLTGNGDPLAWRRHLRRRALAAWCGGLAWLALVLAGNGSFGRIMRVSEKMYDAELVVAVDVSHSMLAIEAGESRLERALSFARAAAAGSPGVRLSLVAFRGAATTLCPSTWDRAAFEDALAWAVPEAAGVPGTDLAAAIDEGVLRHLVDGRGPGTARVVVVLSDGNDTGKTARQAAERAGVSGARLIFVGVGEREPALALYPDGKPVLDTGDQPVRLALAADALHVLARVAGGSYSHIDDPGTLALVANAARDAAESTGAVRTVRLRSGAIPELSLLALVLFACAVLLSGPYSIPRGKKR
ncbi:MAG: VWA domain-containing protein [Spirochaetia bacterium]|jgi:Mg-chelatase subunit ChlD|nr:VWA domain-containing protein [Spirochaetia bacterium]